MAAGTVGLRGMKRGGADLDGSLAGEETSPLAGKENSSLRMTEGDQGRLNLLPPLSVAPLTRGLERAALRPRGRIPGVASHSHGDLLARIWRYLLPRSQRQHAQCPLPCLDAPR